MIYAMYSAGGGDVAEGQGGVHPASPAGAVDPALGQRLSDRTIPARLRSDTGHAEKTPQEPVVSPRPATRPTKENRHDRAYSCSSPPLLAAAPPAATDLCGANLQKLDDILAVRGKTSVTGARVTEVKELQAKARQDQASGDTKGCITATTQALQILQNTGRNDPRQTQGG